MIIKNYISEEIVKILLDYSIFLYEPKNEVVFIPSSQYRRRKTIFDIPKEIYEIKNKLIKDFNIESDETSDIFFNVLKKNQRVERHAHKKHERGDDLRFNIMLQNSEKGGIPKCEEKYYYPKKGDLWIFNGCKDHETDVVQGEKTRYIISYGFIVPEITANKILNFEKKSYFL